MFNNFKNKILFNDDFLKDKNISNLYRFNLELINGREGIYIFLSKSKSVAYIGRSKDIYSRLSQHMRCAFNDNARYDTNSYIPLLEDDTEMYCCFLDSMYNYLNKDDYTLELTHLEGYVVDIIKESGINVVNHNKTYYSTEYLNEEYFKSNEVINITHNLFGNGLKEFLKEKTINKDFLNKDTDDIGFLKYKIEYLKDIYDRERYSNYVAKGKIAKYRRLYSNSDKEIDKMDDKINELSKENDELLIKYKELKSKYGILIKKYKEKESIKDKYNSLLEKYNKERDVIKDIVLNFKKGLYLEIRNVSTKLNYDNVEIFDKAIFEEFKEKYYKTPLYKRLSDIATIIYCTPKKFSLEPNHLKISSSSSFLRYRIYKSSIIGIYIEKYKTEECEYRKNEIINECIYIVYGLTCDFITELGGSVPSGSLDKIISEINIKREV